MVSKRIYSYAEAPSNIAFIKYWGKAKAVEQIPANDSLSMTLSRAVTRTRVFSSDSKNREIRMNGQVLSADSLASQRIEQQLRRIENYFSSEETLSVQTYNTFPTASGMASSASGFAALTLAAAGALSECDHLDELLSKCDLSDLTHLTRLGSGSACRSLWGGFVRWSRSGEVQQVADANHWNLRDVVVIVDPDQKRVSSSEGHHTAQTSPFFELRKTIVSSRLQLTERCIENRDFEQLADIIETDALEMHAIMVSSKPSLRYFSNKSLEIMNYARKLRLEEGLEVCFTLDAGPNVHLICSKHSEQQLQTLIKNDFPDLRVFCDSVGPGPSLWREELDENLTGDRASPRNLRSEFSSSSLEDHSGF